MKVERILPGLEGANQNQNIKPTSTIITGGWPLWSAIHLPSWICACANVHVGSATPWWRCPLINFPDILPKHQKRFKKLMRSAQICIDLLSLLAWSFAAAPRRPDEAQTSTYASSHRMSSRNILFDMTGSLWEVLTTKRVRTWLREHHVVSSSCLSEI